ncbi:MAG: HEAT repeat domain-containing protein [Kiritimatiellia bacterium]
MPSARSILALAPRGFLGGLLLCAACGPSARASVPAAAPQVETETLALAWARDLDAALQVALVEYKPVLALFSLPNCGWCARLKAELAAPALRPVLASYVLVEIDASSSDLAQRYGIRGVPSVVFFSGDGRSRGGFSGYLPAPELKKILAAQVHYAPVDEASDQLGKERFARLAAGAPQADDWPGLMRQWGDPDQRDALRQAILALKPYPAAPLVALLDSPDLAARMGAIELLEERAGEDFGFDPWLSPLDPETDPLRQRWMDWAAAATNAAATNAVYAPLTDSRIAAYVQDILGDDRARASRAMQMLEAGGHHAAQQLAAFVQAHPGLAPGLRQRLRETQYAILLHGTAGHQASATAHQIVFGNLDTRIRTVGSLPETGAGIRAIPILQDLLADENPLLREAACEAILNISGGAGTVLVAPFLKTEKDVNVLFSALRALGRAKSPRAVMALLPFLENENEDLVMVALDGLAKLKYKALSGPLAVCLKDPRWRVRVAALEAVAELKIPALSEAVAAAIGDEDAFVRQAAIGALAAVAEPQTFAARAAAIFREQPEQRPMVLGAMAKHDLEIPPEFIEAIAGDDDPERIATCLGAAAGLEQRALGLAGRLVGHPNPDVSAAALAILMEHGIQDAVQRRHILQALQTRSGDELASLLENLQIDSDDFQPYAMQFRHWLDPSHAAQIAPDPLQTLLRAFELLHSVPTAPVSAPLATNATATPSIDDLVAAFDAAAQGAPGSAAQRPAGFPELIREIEVLASNDHPRVAFLAAVRLVRLGHAGLVPPLVAHLADRTPAERGEIALALRSISTPAARAADLALLADPSSDVRETAAGNLLENFKDDGLAALIDELLRPGTPLRASDLGLRYRTRNLSPAALRKQGHRLLASDPPPFVALGLLLSAYAWEAGDADRIAPFAESSNVYIRAAALQVLGFRSPGPLQKFHALLPGAVHDPSPVVRAAVAQAFSTRDSSESIPLSKDESVGLAFDRVRSGAAAPLDDAARSALRTLAGDAHPPVRFRALLALLTRGETIDAAQLASALEALPDASRASSDVMNALNAFGNATPRPELRALGTVLRRRLDDSYWQDRIDKIFGPPATEEELLAVNVLTRFEPADAPAPLALDPAALAAAASHLPPTLVFFYQPGCKECRQVEALLETMPRYFADLQIQTHNVRRRDAALLNEALCDRFGVPGNSRLVAPALFAADGALIGEAIAFDALADLLSRSAAREDGRWNRPDPSALDAAEKSIQARYGETLKTGVIALVALADGINPCAFATIVFLLSYLQIARRDSRELLQVGGAFILGVFLAYFAMGLGLVALLDRLAFLGGLSRLVNLALAVFVLVVALLSLRDGVLCLRGRMGDMALQLPGAFKRQIHAVIRRGARQRRFVAAAFVIGLLIAAIELPCTGQAYLPTLAYMVRDDALRLNALFHLLLYNVLFIVPLVAVFLFAAFGLTHERLAALLRTHAAAVKFATAALFFVLFAVFLFAG